MLANKDGAKAETGTVAAAVTSPNSPPGLIDNAAGSPDNSISLNDFLDFLNLSCHLNDMISPGSEQAKEPPLTSGRVLAAPPGPPGATVRVIPSSSYTIDFHFLAHNRLANNLFGCKQPSNEPQDDGCTDSGTSSSGGGGDKNRLPRYSSSKTLGLARSRPTKASSNAGDGALHPQLNEKLDYILNEGILDGVLPFICPVPLPDNYNSRLKLKAKESATKNGNAMESEPEATASAAQEPQPANAQQKAASEATEPIPVAEAPKLKEPEVIIHVCDEVKGTFMDFSCPQNLLVSKMGYFADVTAGQKLEDMDISVHCDIQIFDWLMRWVKSDGQTGMGHGDSAHSLNVGNVVPILVSASFLQMEPLLLDCLSYCHSRLGDVVKATSNLSCLNDSIVTRMAAMFTNVELEMVRDKRDRLVPRLWAKLIQSLCEPEPEALRGHHYSLAGLFRCAKCDKCLTNTMKSYVQCIQGNVRLNRWGQLVSHHVRDTSWDLNSYIAQLYKELKSWRRVYWKLWGHSHYLYCCLCEMYFPVYQMSWCRYHPEAPTFLGPVADGRTTGPAGRYACCGQQAFRFETLPGPNGCQYREHSVLVETDRERSILSIAQLAMEGHALADGPPGQMNEAYTSNGEAEARWQVLSLMPQRCRQGLLPTLNPDDSNSRRLGGRNRPASSKFFLDSSSDTESTDNTMENIRTISRKYGYDDCASSFSTSSSDGCESSGSKAAHKIKKSYNKKKVRKGKPIVNPGRHWSGELSARSNQDHQREFEEKVMKHVISMVHKKTGTDVNVSKSNRPLGGIYLRLEQEWREQLKHRGCSLASSSSNTQLNLACSNSSTSVNSKGSRRKADMGGGGGQ